MGPGGETGPSDPSRVEHSQASVKTSHKSGGGRSGVQLVRVKDSKAENVHCKGIGLKRAFVGKAASFTIETKDAGIYTLYFYNLQRFPIA